MAFETFPEAQKTDEASFQEINELLADGWRFRGNFFEKNQTYRLVVSKKGEGEKIFYTTKPYPRSVDAAGNLVETL